MILRIFSSSRMKIQALIFLMILALFLAACGSSSTPAAQGNPAASPTQAQAQVQQPADTQASVPTQPPADTQAPADNAPAAASPTNASYTLTTVCPLITKEEAEATLGSPVTAPEEQNYPPIFSCRYNSGAINMVDVSVVEFPNAMQAEGVFQMAVDINKYPLVSGIGDRAYTSDIYDITADKGKFELSISIISDDDDATRSEKAFALAKLALDRLP